MELLEKSLASLDVRRRLALNSRPRETALSELGRGLGL